MRKKLFVKPIIFLLAFTLCLSIVSTQMTENTYSANEQPAGENVSATDTQSTSEEETATSVGAKPQIASTETANKKTAKSSTEEMSASEGTTVQTQNLVSYSTNNTTQGVRSVANSTKATVKTNTQTTTKAKKTADSKNNNATPTTYQAEASNKKTTKKSTKKTTKKSTKKSTKKTSSITSISSDTCKIRSYSSASLPSKYNTVKKAVYSLMTSSKKGWVTISQAQNYSFEKWIAFDESFSNAFLEGNRIPADVYMDNNGKLIVKVNATSLRSLYKTSYAHYKTMRNILSSLSIKNGTRQTTAVKKINDYLCKKISYKKGQNNMYNALKYGKGNCASYTDCFNILCYYCSIKTTRIDGYGNGGMHCWSKVSFSNTTKYVDVTWNDSSKNSYLLISKTAIQKDHRF